MEALRVGSSAMLEGFLPLERPLIDYDT
jgi:hypothetical protein